MATNYWPLIAVAVVVVFLSLGIPWVLREYFPWRNLWKQRHGRPPVRTSSYQGRTALITGANGAFGSRAARIFAHRDVDTLVLVDVIDCSSLKQQIEEELAAAKKPAPNILVWQVDLMTYAGCQALGQKAKALKTLDHVLMTAGILSFNRRESPEGWETSIQVNYLSNAFIALQLLPLLKSSPSNNAPPVLTFVTTFGVYPALPTMSEPKTGSFIKRLSNNKDGIEQGHQYGRSKALLLYFARELASRAAKVAAEGKGLRKVTINSADPGSAWTPLTNPNRAKLIPRLIMDLGARDPQICATALVNGVSCGESGHGKIMMDFDTAPYPPYFQRKGGQKTQQRVWQETRAELEAKVPDLKSVYEMLER